MTLTGPGSSRLTITSVPDWSYRTVLRPLMLAIGPERSRRLTVSTLSTLSRIPYGVKLIDFLGHMRPDPRLSTRVGPLELDGPIALGALIDPRGEALPAFSRFGVGLIEVGPVSERGSDAVPQWRVDLQQRTVSATEDIVVSVEEVARNLERGEPHAPVCVSIAKQDSEAVRRIVERLRQHAAMFVVDATNVGDACETLAMTPPHPPFGHLLPARGEKGNEHPPLRLAPRAGRGWREAPGEGLRRPLILSARNTHPAADGVWLPAHEKQLESVRSMRAALPANAVIVAGGATEPHEVKQLLEAGANLVAIDAGLICSGPGLVKRCNEALAAEAGLRIEDEGLRVSEASSQASPNSQASILNPQSRASGHPQSRASGNPQTRASGHTPPPALPAAREAWFWASLMGVAMFVGGIMAVIIASTRVVLPYDESLCGLTRAQMAALNPRLLPFMAHDRVSLAGAMLSIGIFYTALGWSGIRKGAHWAHVTVIASATVGFLTFFTFLGFGYFDPFHAFVTAILTQFLLLCLVMRPSPVQVAAAEWHETAAWRRGQWGQLLFILLGVGLTVAGMVITVIGMTRVFVQTDLEFMRTTAAQLALSYERLIPLVAHDRATLGGMLIANGVTVWLSAQWGFRAGAKWLWLALAWGGNLAFFCAMAVHLAVRYNDPLHLAPALLGWVLWNVALVLTRQWLCATRA